MIHYKSRALAASLALAATGGLVAQVQPGQPAPEIEFRKVWNDGPQSFDELDGRVVLLEFSETW